MTAEIASFRALVAASVSERSFSPPVRPGSTDSFGLSGFGAALVGTGGTAAASATAALYIESKRRPTDCAISPACSPAFAKRSDAWRAASAPALSHLSCIARVSAMRCIWNSIVAVVDAFDQAVTSFHIASLSMLFTASQISWCVIVSGGFS
ncbi:hypothetical protein [Nocardia sp. bgisy118]|uniref:hypothetical protein n=1 Tax=Nocardia sp. bgisy118 TaxID=3413786 RepID=UPI003F49DEBF